MLGMLQIAVIMLVLGQPGAAGHIFLLALGLALMSPWFWGTVLGLSSIVEKK